MDEEKDEQGFIPVFQPGELAQFAVAHEKSVDSMEEYIDKLVTEAAYSFIEHRKRMLSELEDLYESNNKMDTLATIVGKENIIEAVKNPIEFFAKDMVKKKNFKLRDVSKRLFSFLKETKESAVVEGNLMRKHQLNLEQAFQLEAKRTIIPTSKKNIFLQIGENKIPETVFLSEGKLKNLGQLIQMPEETRKTIINMVKLFLAEKNLLGKEDEDRISKKVDKIEELLKGKV